MSERSTAMAETIPRHRFSVDDYERMVEAGILTENDKVELIRGEIVVMAPIGSRHSACVSRLNEVFEGLRELALRRVQDAIRLSDSEPEPDLVLVSRHDDYYAAAHPTPDDIHLVVEVADTSQRFDREVKGALYAENRIREYWLVDVEANRIEIRREPEGTAWRETRTAGPGETIRLAAFPDYEVRTDDVIP